MKLNHFFAAASLACTLLLITGCGTPSKTNPGYQTDDGTGALPQGGTDTLPGPDGGIPQTRPDGVNPNTDVDYSALATDTVYFDFDKSTIRPSERGKLDDISKYLTTNAGKRLMIAGHTDLTGTSKYNTGLGERRALAVRSYLIGLGVPASQLFTISYGMDRPASPGHAEADNALNRRAVPGVITK